MTRNQRRIKKMKRPLRTFVRRQKRENARERETPKQY